MGGDFFLPSSMHFPLLDGAYKIQIARFDKSLSNLDPQSVKSHMF